MSDPKLLSYFKNDICNYKIEDILWTHSPAFIFGDFQPDSFMSIFQNIFFSLKFFFFFSFSSCLQQEGYYKSRSSRLLKKFLLK